MSRLSRFIHFYADDEEQGLPKDYKRLLGFSFNASTHYLITGFKLKGSDTVRFSLSVLAACNVFGCYTNTSAQDNYSLYVSTTSNSKYLRYNGGTYKSYWGSSVLGERFDIIITPTGSHGMPGAQDDTWEEVSFEAPVDMCIGTTSADATSAKLKGSIYGNFVVDRRLNCIPCERVSDGVLGYYDTYSKMFYEPIGIEPTSLGYA